MVAGADFTLRRGAFVVATMHGPVCVMDNQVSNITRSQFELFLRDFEGHVKIKSPSFFFALKKGLVGRLS